MRNLMAMVSLPVVLNPAQLQLIALMTEENWVCTAGQMGFTGWAKLSVTTFLLPASEIAKVNFPCTKNTSDVLENVLGLFLPFPFLKHCYSLTGLSNPAAMSSLFGLMNQIITGRKKNNKQNQPTKKIHTHTPKHFFLFAAESNPESTISHYWTLGAFNARITKPSSTFLFLMWWSVSVLLLCPLLDKDCLSCSHDLFKHIKKGPWALERVKSNEAVHNDI